MAYTLTIKDGALAISRRLDASNCITTPVMASPPQRDRVNDTTTTGMVKLAPQRDMGNSAAPAGMVCASPQHSTVVPANQVKKYTHTSAQTEEELIVNKFMQELTGVLQSGQYSDVILNVKGKELSGHKIILAARSPVFAAMWEHDTKEKATGIVNIDDSDPDTFFDFLRFMYSGCTQHLSSENVVGLYIVADKYQVTELSQACTMYMIRHISLETFCDIMALSLRYHHKELTEVATKYFLQNSIDIVKTVKWLTFMKENLVAGNELFLKALQSKRQ